VALRDLMCVFPWCTRPARNLHPDRHGCDCDHVTPYQPGGPPGQTCTCKLAPLCRRHHRVKTHSAWTYTMAEPRRLPVVQSARLPVPAQPQGHPRRHLRAPLCRLPTPSTRLTAAHTPPSAGSQACSGTFRSPSRRLPHQALLVGARGAAGPRIRECPAGLTPPARAARTSPPLPHEAAWC
jgi:hypothetical protein